MNPYLLVLILYSLVLIGLGLVLSRHVKSSGDFYVAGRKLSPGLLFATMLAANIGAGSTVGAAGLGYSIGLSAWWWVGSAGIGSLILAATVGPRIRDLAARKGFYTVGDFLEFRFGSPVRTVIAVLLWLGTLSILAGQLIAVSRILNVVASIPKTAGCLLGGVVAVLYFSAGGLKGTVWVNLLQLSVKAAGFLISLPLVLLAVGSWSGMKSSLTAAGISASYFHFLGNGWSDVLPYVALLVPSFIVSPGLVQKVFGARDAGAVRRGVGLNGAALLIFSFFPVLLGMAAAVRFPGLEHPELALPTVLTGLLPVWLGALLLASVFSAEVSSADAILFMLSTSLSRDLFQRHIRPDLDDNRLLRISRRIALAAGFLGILLAVLLESVISALSIFYSLLSVALFAPLVVGLYRKYPGGFTCLVSIAVSLAATLGVYLWTEGAGIGWFSPTAFGIGMQ